MLALLLCFLLPGTGIAGTAGPGHVVMQVAVVRHGIRAPTDTPKALATYATAAWPAWPVAPGELTAHGARLMQSVGAWYREHLAAGYGGGDCTALSARLKVIADSKQRNLDSAAALLKGFAPACTLRYHALAAGHKDPLFRGLSETVHVTARVGPLGAPTLAALHTLQATLLGCHGGACLDRARSAGKTLLLGAPPDAAMHMAGTLSENLMLEYAQGMPLEHVAWGRLGADGIAWIITLHNASFNLRQRPHGPASVREGNMLAHIVATLAHAAGQRASLPSLAAAGNAMVVLVGHDTDLATEAGLLGVDWHAVAQADDYPPGGTLIYQLLDEGGRYGVRLRVALPTLPGLRAADVRRPGGMHVMTVRQPRCGNVQVCPLARFRALVKRAVPASVVIPDSGNEPMVH